MPRCISVAMPTTMPRTPSGIVTRLWRWLMPDNEAGAFSAPSIAFDILIELAYAAGHADARDEAWPSMPSPLIAQLIERAAVAHQAKTAKRQETGQSPVPEWLRKE